jgi:isopenicillin-N N-acyltransferase-like protein
LDRQIPVVVSSGTPFERGLQLGRQETARVAHTVSAYMTMFQQIAGLNGEAARARAATYVPVIESFAPHLLEEIRGIAAGSGCDFADLLAVNTRTELLYGNRQISECTALAVSGAASADGHVRLAQNWDWHHGQAGGQVLWVIRREDGPDLVTLAEAGMVGKIGMNAAGLGLCVNLLVSSTDNPGPAVPMHILLRRILEQATTVAEAVALIAATPRCTSCNHLLADRWGALADVEATAAGQAVLYPEEGRLCHSNHCLAAGLVATDLGRTTSLKTLLRAERARTLAAAEPLDKEGIQDILRDHQAAICRHVDFSLPFASQSESIASIVMDLTAATIDLSDGPPCSYVYRHVDLAAYLRPSAERLAATVP